MHSKLTCFVFWVFFFNLFCLFFGAVAGGRVMSGVGVGVGDQ